MKKLNCLLNSIPFVFCIIALLSSEVSEVEGQNYQYSTNFGRPGSGSGFGFQTGAGARSFGGGGQRGFGSNVPGPQRPTVTGTQGRRNNNNVFTGNTGNTAGDLQTQFTDMFDWNRDLSTDPRFTSCTVPDIEDVSRSCPKRAFYYGINADHRRALGIVKRILMSTNNAQETVCLAGAMRDLAGMNPNVWIRGMLGASASNENLFNLQMPPLVEVMPNIFINSEAIQQAKRQIPMAQQNRTCVVVDGKAGRDNGIENLLWYWREDILVNAFHLNWHLTYPFRGITTRADRRGELFYFTHHSHLARYHAERLSNGLGKVVPLNVDVNVPVPDPYNPHLDDTNSAQRWTPRRPNSVLQDTTFIAIDGIPPNVSIADRVLHVQRVEQSIYTRELVLPNGRRMNLNSINGIDALGDVVEASEFSVNADYYGRFGFHNEGHVLLGLVEDPQNRTSIPPGVMVETATAMRDPVFYTYHASMDAVFERHKETLTPYQPERGELPLKWPGVEITHFHVKSNDGEDFNNVKTFFTQRTFEMTRGLDFNRSGVQGIIQACVKHLDHVGFEYDLSVNRRDYVSSDKASVRVFLAPRFDENGRRYAIDEQRKLFFMLDLFTVNLKVGPNRITRRSAESTLTINIPQSIHDIMLEKKDRKPYCGCGWPHHLLIPKGTERGMIFDLFVMLTDGNIDYVPLSSNRGNQDNCKPAPIYCGRLNDTYFDSKPMGYPFDRRPYSSSSNSARSTIEQFVYGIQNMATIPIKITHLQNQPNIQVSPTNTNTNGRRTESQQPSVSSSEIDYSDESGDSYAHPSFDNSRSQYFNSDEYLTQTGRKVPSVPFRSGESQYQSNSGGYSSYSSPFSFNQYYNDGSRGQSGIYGGQSSTYFNRGPKVFNPNPQLQYSFTSSIGRQQQQQKQQQGNFYQQPTPTQTSTFSLHQNHYYK